MNSHTIPQFAVCLLRALAVLAIAANAPAQAAGTPLPLAPLPPEMEAAWKHRTNAIKSLTIKADIDEFIKGRGDSPKEPDSPFANSPPKGDRNYKATLEFAFEQGKAAVTHSGHVTDVDHPEKSRQQTDRAAFDGRVNMRLIEETGFQRTGSVERMDFCDGRITQDANLLGVNLWLQPNVTFLAVGYSLENMRVEQDPVDVDGISCRRIHISRSTPRYVTTIDVDPNKEWVPVQLLSVFDGRPSMKVTIKYGIDKNAGPVVTEWVFTNYNKAGDIEKTRKAKVTQYQVNGEIDDKRFAIEFPIGTLIVERNGNDARYYVQQAGGRVSIKASEFGRPKPDSSGE